MDQEDLEHLQALRLAYAKRLRVLELREAQLGHNTPGHCAGQLAFLWPQQGVLFAGDACGNLPRLGLSVAYEDLQVGKQSLANLANLDFAVAYFGHGKAIQCDAAAQFRKHW
jgi:glyoxylase-like metal-dependent hydrolase (beta-lactamase superfamily II)